MNHLDIVRSFSRRMKLELSYGGNSNARVHMMERCIGGDLLEVHLSPGEDEFADAQEFGWTLIVEVCVKRAPYEFEKPVWRWEPKEIATGRIGFHHWDHEQLVQRAAEWLLKHEDHKTGLIPAWEKHTKQVVPLVKAIKCSPIGRIKHYTTVEGFENE